MEGLIRIKQIHYLKLFFERICNYISLILLMQEEKPAIDHNAMSRQIAVYGAEAQGKLMVMRVFIHGVTGVGVQVAKNLILAGPKEVALYDNNKVTLEDVGRNFFITEKHVNTSTRAQACLADLRNLNTNVSVNVATSDDIEYISNNFECVVVLDDYRRDYLIALNKACRKNSVGFILAGNLGLYGYTFVDFGDAHKCFDATGEEQKQIHIAGITQEEKGLVCLHEDKKHGLQDGDTIEFREVKGMSEINGLSFQVEVKSPTSFTIGDTRNFSPHVNGGIGIEKKMPVSMHFNELEKSLRYPYASDCKELPIANWEKFGVPEQLHVILNALHIFYDKNQRLPQPLNEEDAQQLIQNVKEFQSKKMEIEGEDFKVDNVSDDLVKNVAKYAVAQISPCSSFWGGIITQEIVKLTGKYSPLRQWLHHEFFEVLPEGNVTRTPNQSVYSDYVMLFGDEFMKKAANSSSFVIGAGALGCEFIKMFALMGLSTQGGKLSVTDDDNIEISNLNRQFLFRREHVGHNKCETACKVGAKMNKDTRFDVHKLRVAPENEEIFNDQFWTNLDFVVNAVDNVKARQYVDKNCVWYEKPLFESGTLGTKCHSQIIIPHFTQSYTDIVDPPEESIPLCTLKNFPYQIEHTIQWARDYFEGVFADPSADLFKYYHEHESFLKQLKTQHRQNPTVLKAKLETLLSMYENNEKKTFENCVTLTAEIFQEVFNNQIKQLLNAFPEDHIIEETGKPFWSGLKRAPKPFAIDFSDPIHVQFLQAGSNIFATMFGLPMEKNPEVVINIAKNVKLTEFQPKKIKIETDESKKEPQPVELNDDDEKDADELYKKLLAYKPDSKHAPTVIEFEKDDPTNFHIEFMAGVSNLRARNYKIEEVDNFKVKLIAGKIIPAIATTTAMVVGAVGIQIIKFLLNKKAQVFKNVTINLALPLWVFNDPLEPIMNEDKEMDPIMLGPIKVIPGKFTKWDKINIKGPMTVEDCKKHFEETYKIEVSMITYGTSTVYSSFGSDGKKRMGMKMPEAIENVTKKEFPKWRRFIPIGISGNLADGVDCILPEVRYQI